MKHNCLYTHCNDSILSGLKTAFVAVSIATIASLVNADDAPGESKDPEAAEEPIRVFIIDDQTGEELRTRHGIQPLQVEDVDNLVNAVLLGKKPVHLIHQAVDEDATDSGLTQMIFKPFDGGSAPTAPRPNMPLRQFAELAKKFQANRAIWQRKIREYRRSVEFNAENFIMTVAQTQFEVAERFDRILEERNGRDFNRSDIVGSIVEANRILGTSGRRVLILNTDANDLPAKREPRRTPLTSKEIDPGIEMVFVNMSRLPEQSILFTGLMNPVYHADSVKEAMDLVAGMISSSETDADRPEVTTR